MRKDKSENFNHTEYDEVTCIAEGKKQAELKKTTPLQFIFRIFQGALIGLGAVLPGISGGVLGVIFGIYKPLMEFISHPFSKFKELFPRLLPVFIGGVIGFLGVAKVLAFFLETYPDPSVCLFIGLIAGMIPSLFKEAGKEGRGKDSYISLFVCMSVIFAVLIGLNLMEGYEIVKINANFFWYIFCGFCLALSIIAPGMSFSTLLMPLGLYTPFVDGIGSLDFSVLIPAGIGAIATVICLAKGINALFDRHYSIAFHGIVGIVIAATVMIIPFQSFIASAQQCIVNLICLVVGIIIALFLDKFNSSVEVE